MSKTDWRKNMKERFGAGSVTRISAWVAQPANICITILQPSEHPVDSGELIFFQISLGSDCFYLMNVSFSISISNG